ncbi:unnamed protein product [Rotaria sp. Silwood1]|nr:unnamed protein product [Rotaria sp. Silwood1]
MTYNTQIVLFCEGKATSIDSKIYTLCFDPKKVEIRPVAGGFADVQKKTLAAKNAADLLRSKRLYYGLCDRDRNIVIALTDVCMLPVAEIENMFWMPDMWSLYEDMLLQLQSQQNEVFYQIF